MGIGNLYYPFRLSATALETAIREFEKIYKEKPSRLEISIELIYTALPLRKRICVIPKTCLQEEQWQVCRGEGVESKILYSRPV